MNRHTGFEIAIVGMCGRFPGADDIHSFWNNLKNGIESINFFTDEELLSEGEDAGIISNPSYVKANAYISGKEFFDAEFFSFRPEEAELMDPQMRVFIETCWNAIEDAGYDIENCDRKVGIFAGGSNNINWETYTILKNQEGYVDNYTASQLRDINFLCSRVAYLFNLQGPAVYVDTACSTSLVAVQRACMSLLLRECNMALAGGVSVHNASKRGYLYQEGMINSRDGHCRTFDQHADGTLSGEGCGVVVLKRLSDAINDRDHIYAIIKGSAINNDGSEKASYTAPGVEGQSKVIVKAINMAKVEPESISYIEAHGTGTKLGDPIEVEALNLAFGKEKEKHCALGSVKSNIGHLDTAAGAAGLIKTVLALKHRQLPPSLHFHSPNPRIDFENGPFFVNAALTDWKNEKYPLRAGVSSFGIGGTNAHIILEEALPPIASSESRDYQLLVFSAKTPAALKRNIENFKTYILENKKEKLADIAYTLQTGRMAHAYRHTVICENNADANELLPLLHPAIEVVQVSDRRERPVVFMFSGQGAQYENMCRDLYVSEPVFREQVDQCFDIAQSITDKDLKSVFLNNRQDGLISLINETEYTQSLLFIVEYALARLLMQWGVHPTVMIGHSIGEYVAACISGVFSFEDALTLVVKRGALMQTAPKGSMLSIAISESALRPLLDNHPELSLAAVNSSELCVVSGTEAAISAFKEFIEQHGYNSRVLHTSHAFHSYMMDDILDEFEEAVKKTSFGTQKIPFIANLTGKAAEDKDINQPKYWASHLRQTVHFSKGIKLLLVQKDAIFIEIGPGNALSTFVRSHTDWAEQQVINAVRHVNQPVNDVRHLLGCLAALWVNGVKPDWNRFYEHEMRQKVSLPGYSFDKLKYTAIVDAYKMVMHLKSDVGLGKHADISKWFYTPSWKLAAPVMQHPAKNAAGCTLIFADDCGIADALLTKYEENEETIVCVRTGKDFREVSSVSYILNPSGESGYTSLFHRLAEYGLLPHTIVHAWGVTQAEAMTDTLMDTCFYSLPEIIKACQAQGGIFDKQIIVLTSDLHPVGIGGKIHYRKSLAPGLLNVLSLEYPSVLASHIDIAFSEANESARINDLYLEIKEAKTGDVVSLRHSNRWIQIYDRLASQNVPFTQTLKEEGVYLITGGLGNVGFNISRYLLHTYKAKVILVGRTRLPVLSEWNSYLQREDVDKALKEKIQRLRELQAAPGEILYLNCDVSDARELFQVIEIAEGRFGTLHGVVHAAGIVDGTSFNTIPSLSRADFSAQFQAKINGLEALTEVLGNRDLDFCLVTSSLSAVLGGIGFGAYASANIYMDYFIKARRNEGDLKNWISINLDGLNFQKNVTKEINAAELLQVFNYALRLKNLPQLVVSVSDLDKRLEKWLKRGDIQEQEMPVNHDEAVEVAYEAHAGETVSLSSPERELTAIWGSFFGKAEVGADDDFFTIGGDSLKALTMVGRIHKALHVEVPLVEFFKRPSIRLLSDYIQSKKEEKSQSDTGRYVRIPKAGKRDYYHLSSMQKRIYLQYEFDKQSTAYNLPKILELTGNLNKEQLRTAFKKLVARHESLRTSFTVISEEPVQIIADHVDFEIAFYSCKEMAAAEIIMKEFVRPFDLSKTPIRVGLIELEQAMSTASQMPSVYILLADMHHIIMDGISHDILIRDFMAFYNNEALPELALQYKDYAEWQHSEAYRKSLTKQTTFWHNVFAEPAPALDLPTDYVRPAEKNYLGVTYFTEIDAETTRRLKSIAEKEGCTLFMVLLGVYNIMLSKFSGQQDIVVGSAVAGRLNAGLENIIGAFINTIPLRNFPNADRSFKDFLLSVKVGALACFDNQEYPYDQLIDHLKIERNAGRNPLFDVMFDLQNFEVSELKLPDITLKQYGVGHAVSKFDITLTAIEAGDRIALNFEYASALFNNKTVDRFVSCFKKIISAIIEDVDIKIADISILSNEEQHQLLYECNDTETAFPDDRTIVALFEEQVKKSPENIALRYRDKIVSYKELNELSNQMAALLVERYKVKKGALIGITLPREEYLIVAILGVLKAGCAYVPIDPAIPAVRINSIIEDAGITILIAREGELSPDITVPASVIDIDMAVEIMQYIGVQKTTGLLYTSGYRDLAYVIYTSGSTGKPKGVMIEHQSLVNYIWWAAQFYLKGEKAAMPLCTSISFDLTITSVFVPLITGNEMVIYNEHDHDVVIERVFAENKAHVIKLTPSHLKIIRDSSLPYLVAGSTPKKLIVGGEQLETILARDIYEKFDGQVEIYNEYGPTEATVGCMIYKFDPDEDRLAVPIGIPVSNTQIYLLDKSLQPVPLGMDGEIYISGAGLAAGYLADEELTARKFVANPFRPGERMYKTGDLASRENDGNIIFKGRADDQVKIRGYRIEPGDIKNQLLQYGLIKEAIVIAKEKGGLLCLVAYYLSDYEIEAEELRSFLNDRLPEYMVPPYLVRIAELPLTLNGKVNVKALPDPINLSNDNYIAPRTTEEKLLAEVWSNVLGVEQVGILNSFFADGGDSIRSIQIISRMRSLGYELSMMDIFTDQTIEKLAVKLKQVTVVSDQSLVTGKASLTPIQKWFFEGSSSDKHHFNQSVMLHFTEGISRGAINKIFEKLKEHHDALRMVFKEENGIVIQECRGDMSLSLEEFELAEAQNPETDLLSAANQIQSTINLANGPLMKLGLFHMRDGSRLLIVVHHLVIDGVSWRILFEDINLLYRQVTNNEPLSLPAKTDSFLSWSAYLAEYIQTETYKKAKEYWHSILHKQVTPISNSTAEPYMRHNSQHEIFSLDKELTRKLLTDVHGSFNTQINDLLLAALLLAIKKQYSHNAVMIDLETHGRELTHTSNINISRTVGWFTGFYPVVLECEENSLPAIIKNVKESIRKVPNKGIDYLSQKYLDPSGENMPATSRSQICFNYLGQFDADTGGKSFVMAKEATGDAISRNTILNYDLDISGMISGGQLEIRIIYNGKQYQQQSIGALIAYYKESLTEIINYCCAYEKKELTPSDLTYKGLQIAQLNELQAKYPVQDIYPLSPMQAGILFHTLLDPESDHYFQQITYQVQGDLDLAAIQKSMEALTARYDILRTLFLPKGYEQPLQLVLQHRPIDLTFKDERDACGKTSEEEVIRFYQAADKSTKFDLTKDVLMRLLILQTADHRYSFIWSYPHILLDGWCMGIIVNDFNEMYSTSRKGAKINMPVVKPYSQYIKWLQTREKNASKNYWKNYLKDYVSLATLPKKTITSGGNIPFVASSLQISINKEQTKLLHAVSRTYGVTLNTIIQTAWGIVLSKYNNSEDVVFGSVVSGRPAEIEGIESMIGLFINTIPVRVQHGSDYTIGRLLQQVQNEALESEQYHYSSLAEIQSLSELGSRLLDHILVFENYPIADQLEESPNEEREQLQVTNVQLFERPNYDFWVMIMPGEEIRIELGYNASVYAAETIERVAVHLQEIIQKIIVDSNARIGSFGVVSENEKQQILYDFNNTKRSYASHLLMHQLFEQQVERTPNHTALIGESIRYSYAWLNATSNKLANYLRKIGISRGSSVVIIMDRQVEMIVALMAILKAGGKYIPIEPYLPDNRKKVILNAVDALCIITQKRYDQAVDDLGKEIPSVKHIITADHNKSQTIDITHSDGGKYSAIDLAGYSPLNLVSCNESEDLAYVIFTSGSSGEPKGVAVQHKPVINLIEWVTRTYNVGGHDTILFVSSISFDLSVYDLFGGLATGACVRIANRHELEDPERLATIVIEEGITFWDSAPAMLQQIIPFLQRNREQAIQKGNLRLAFLSGDWIPLTMPVQMKELFHKLQFIALGGATEATVWSNFYEVEQVLPEWTSIPYGKPMQNARYLVLDKDRNLCPVGIPGDLYIGGECLAKEYMNDKELSAAKFIPSPFYAGEMLYSTGDMASWFADGNIEFLGRKDFQVKIRGYRIELGEIERKLAQFSGVDHVLAQVIAKSKYDKFICAYYIAEKVLDEEVLKDFLRKDLPDYMLPKYFVHMEEMPMTKNGKVDRKRLPLPEPVSGSNKNAKSSKRLYTPTEKALINIWSELLYFEADKIGVEDDFFLLGGHSIMAVHLINAIQQQFEVTIKLREVFEHSSIDKLSLLIERTRTESQPVMPYAGDLSYYPASAAQKRLFYEQISNVGSTRYNIAGSYKITGSAYKSKLQAALQTLVNRHKSLRTCFSLTDTNEVIQTIKEEVDFELEILDPYYDTVEDAYEQFIKPFDLMEAPLMRCALFSHDRFGNYLFVDIHHIICDGVSLNILMNEFKDIYLGNPLPPLELQYVDYAAWYNSRQNVLQKQKEFWLKQLSGELQPLQLPVIQDRNLVDIHPAACKILEIDNEVREHIRRFTAESNVSEFMFLLSVTYILLSKISGNTDMIIGTDVIGRTHPACGNMVGTFINLLPLRAQLRSGASYETFLQQVKECVLGAYDNQDFQIEEIVSLVNRGNKLGRKLVDVHFAFVNYFDARPEEKEWEIVPYEVQRQEFSQFEFKLEVVERINQMHIRFVYSKALYDENTIDLLIGYFNNILMAVLNDSSTIIENLEMEIGYENF